MLGRTLHVLRALLTHLIAFFSPCLGGWPPPAAPLLFPCQSRASPLLLSHPLRFQSAGPWILRVLVPSGLQSLLAWRATLPRTPAPSFVLTPLCIAILTVSRCARRIEGISSPAPLLCTVKLRQTLPWILRILLICRACPRFVGHALPAAPLSLLCQSRAQTPTAQVC